MLSLLKVIFVGSKDFVILIWRPICFILNLVHPPREVRGNKEDPDLLVMDKGKPKMKEHP